MRTFAFAVPSRPLSLFRRFATRCLFFAGLALVGCAQNPMPAHKPTAVTSRDIVITEKFQVRPVTVEGYPAEVSQCLGLVTTAAQAQRRLAEFGGLPIKDGTYLVVRNPKRGGALVIFRSSVICLDASDAGYPVLPTEVLSETVEPSGVPDDVKQDWYRQILRILAQKGTARVLYQYDNGNATAAVYWVKRGEADSLSYGSDFKRAGQFRVEDYDLLFKHVGLSGIVSTRIELETGIQTYSRSFYKAYTGRLTDTDARSLPRRVTPTPN